MKGTLLQDQAKMTIPHVTYHPWLCVQGAARRGLCWYWLLRVPALVHGARRRSAAAAAAALAVVGLDPQLPNLLGPSLASPMQTGNCTMPQQVAELLPGQWWPCGVTVAPAAWKCCWAACSPGGQRQSSAETSGVAEPPMT